MSVQIRNFLKARRDRALGMILGTLEADLRSKISREEWEDIRSVVLDGVNGYHDAVLDLMKSDDGSSIRNDEVVAMLSRLDTALARGQRTAAHQ